MTSALHSVYTLVFPLRVSIPRIRKNSAGGFGFLLEIREPLTHSRHSKSNSRNIFKVYYSFFLFLIRILYVFYYYFTSLSFVIFMIVLLVILLGTISLQKDHFSCYNFQEKKKLFYLTSHELYYIDLRLSVSVSTFCKLTACPPYHPQTENK